MTVWAFIVLFAGQPALQVQAASRAVCNEYAAELGRTGKISQSCRQVRIECDEACVARAIGPFSVARVR